MKSDKKGDQILKKPWYKGGSKALSSFIQSNLIYPSEAIEANKYGVVNLRITIDYTGIVTEAKVIQGIGFGCDEEAIRLVKLLKFEVAKTPRKLKVTFHKKIKVNFPKEILSQRKSTKSQNVSYTYTSKKENKPIETKSKEQGKTYSYTIRLQ